MMSSVSAADWENFYLPLCGRELVKKPSSFEKNICVLRNGFEANRTLETRHQTYESSISKDLL